jgi:hypothetical protein
MAGRAITRGRIAVEGEEWRDGREYTITRILGEGEGRNSIVREIFHRRSVMSFGATALPSDGISLYY